MSLYKAPFIYLYLFLREIRSKLINNWRAFIIIKNLNINGAKIILITDNFRPAAIIEFGDRRSSSVHFIFVGLPRKTSESYSFRNIQFTYH